MRGRKRPWRAVAYKPDATAPNGRARAVTGQVAACSRVGLRAFVQRQQAAGNVVDVYLNAELVATTLHEPAETIPTIRPASPPVPGHTEAAWADAEADLREAYAQLDDADRGEWERNLIMAAIKHCADQGMPFSANDVRALELLGDVNTARIGRCFSLAAERGLIEFVSYVRSTDRGTHGKRIAVWRKGQQPAEAVAS